MVILYSLYYTRTIVRQVKLTLYVLKCALNKIGTFLNRSIISNANNEIDKASIGIINFAAAFQAFINPWYPIEHQSSLNDDQSRER